MIITWLSGGEKPSQLSKIKLLLQNQVYIYSHNESDSLGNFSFGTSGNTTSLAISPAGTAGNDGTASAAWSWRNSTRYVCMFNKMKSSRQIIKSLCVHYTQKF